MMCRTDIMWWKNVWWIRVANGPQLRTARGRRRTWRAARRAAKQARDEDGVEESQRSSRRGRGGEMEKKEMGARESQKRRKQHPARCLPFRKRSSAFAVTHTVAAVMVGNGVFTTSATVMWTMVGTRQEQTNLSHFRRLFPHFQDQHARRGFFWGGYLV